MPENLTDEGWAKIVIAVPPELLALGVEDDIQRFVDFMVYKLRRNAHKGRWSGMTVDKAVSDLRREVDELDKAVRAGSTAEIWMEAADVANEALIVAAAAHETKRAVQSTPEARQEAFDRLCDFVEQRPQVHELARRAAAQSAEGGEGKARFQDRGELSGGSEGRVRPRYRGCIGFRKEGRCLCAEGMAQLPCPYAINHGHTVGELEYDV